MTRSQSTPHWIEQPAPPDSYRSLFKWGDPKGFRHPNRGMYALLKEAFGMTDADFAEPRRTGMEKFAFDAPLKMDSARLQALGQIVGAENVSTDPYARVRVRRAAAARTHHRKPSGRGPRSADGGGGAGGGGVLRGGAHSALRLRRRVGRDARPRGGAGRGVPGPQPAPEQGDRLQRGRPDLRAMCNRIPVDGWIFFCGIADRTA
jgi:hypothetical protein